MLSNAGATFARARRRWPDRSRCSSRRCASRPPTSRSASTSTSSVSIRRSSTRRSATTRSWADRSTVTSGSRERCANPSSSVVSRSRTARTSATLERVPITQIGRGAGVQSHERRRSSRIARARNRNGRRVRGASSFRTASIGAASSLAVQGRARGAQLDLPAYGNGTLDARIALNKTARSNALLSGNVDAEQRHAAVLLFHQGGAAGARSAPRLPLPPLAFDLTRHRREERTRARQRLRRRPRHRRGRRRSTWAARLLRRRSAGTFDSTGGTLTYFDRAFRVQQGSVSLSTRPTACCRRSTPWRRRPSSIRTPIARAIRTGPPRSRSPSTGRFRGCKIGFTSNPPGYTQDQIIAMIAPVRRFRQRHRVQ